MPIAEYITTREANWHFGSWNALACIANTPTLDGIILSVGGGTPCFYDNMQVMEGLGHHHLPARGSGVLNEAASVDSALAGNPRPLLGWACPWIDSYAEFIGKHLLRTPGLLRAGCGSAYRRWKKRMLLERFV